MDLFTSPCFIVHLPKHTERLPVYEKVVRAGFQEVYWFNAIDGNHLPTIKHLVGRLRLRLDHGMTSGTLGCLLSHLCLLQKIIQLKLPQATIFEDDVTFHPEWSTLAPLYMEKTPTYEVLFLGNQLDSCRVAREPGPQITQEPVYCTHAYTVTLEGAEKLYHSLIHWSSEGTPYHGITMIDFMIKEIQKRANQRGEIPFVWYSWDGTYYPCSQNQLPLSYGNARNSGLVFQDMRLPTTVQQTERVNLGESLTLPSSRRKGKSMSFFKNGSS